MRRIAVVTVARSDYGIYRPILSKIEEMPDLELQLIVAGMHLCPEFGSSERIIEQDARKAAARVHMLIGSDEPEAIAQSSGLGTMGYARAFAQLKPDIIAVLGDRFEMHAAAVAALPMKIPLAHIHGGELTAGAIDDSLRHSMTKLSHLHFVSTQEYRDRVIQLGEEPWRVTMCGAPSLDNLKTYKFYSLEDVGSRLGIKLNASPILVTYHPVTLEFESAEEQIEELLRVLSQVRESIVFTLPNADTNGRLVAERISQFCTQHENAILVDNLGTDYYFSMMRLSKIMIGNSSSGIIEAPSFGLPVVNIGCRQEGRVRARNVIDVDCKADEISKAMKKACSKEFKQSLDNLENPYGTGNASEAIVRSLQNVEISQKLLVKRFVTL